MAKSSPGAARCRVVFSPRYDFGSLELEQLHPFDGRKYGKAWALLRRRFGDALGPRHIEVDRPIRRDELLRVHGADYLDSLGDPAVLAQALEVPPLSALPAALLDREVLEPMRWAVRGTVLAAEAALEHGAAVNLGGGFHHAKRHRGEGFTLYSDLAVAVELLDAAGRLGRRGETRVGFIDLDAHQGNGPKSIFAGDDRACFLDVFNGQIYPGERFDIAPPSLDVELPMGIGTAAYLAAVEESVPAFLDAAGEL
ncbi:MAG: histone deacetylase, partial [Acidobacteriota bacterium]